MVCIINATADIGDPKGLIGLLRDRVDFKKNI